MRVLCIVQTTAHPAELRRHQATGLPHIHHAERQEVGEGNRRRVHSPPSRIVRFATFTSLYPAAHRRVRHSAGCAWVCLIPATFFQWGTCDFAVLPLEEPLLCVRG